MRSRLLYVSYGCNRSNCDPAKPVSFPGGIYRSQDGGDTFQRIGGSNEPTLARRMALGPDGSLLIVPNSSDGNAVNGIFKWDGTAWSILPGTETTPFKAIASDPADRRRIVAWGKPAFYHDLWRSTDGGQSWSVAGYANKKLTLNSANWLKSSFTINSAYDVQFDPLHRDRIYWSEAYAVYRMDNAFSETVVARPLVLGSETTVNLALAAPPTNKAAVELYSTAGDVRGFRHTDLTSLPQTQVISGGGYLSDVAYAPSDPASVIVLRSVENGNEDEYADKLPRLFLSQDQGKSWVERLGPPADTASTSSSQSAGAARLAISATDRNRVVYWGAKRVPYYTTNAFGGASITWKAATGVPWNLWTGDSPYNSDMVRLGADAVDGKRFFLMKGDWNAETPVYVSSDGGATWQVPTGQTALPRRKYPENHHLATVMTASDPTPANGELWVSLGGNGLWRSTDGGTVFSQVNPAAIINARGVAFGAKAPNSLEPTLYVAGEITLNGQTKDGVFYSIDLGQTFMSMTSDAAPLIGGSSIQAMVGDPDSFGRVYIGTGGSGVLYSEVEAAPSRQTFLPLLLSGPAKPFYQVWINDKPVTVETTPCRPIGEAAAAPSTCSFVSAELAAGAAAVLRVRTTVPITGALVRPLAKAISPTVSGDELRFTLSEPQKLYLEVNADRKSPLLLFMNRPISRPNANDPKVTIFEAGVHDIGHRVLQSGETLYLAPGAVVRGSLYGADVHDVKIIGNGMLDGSTTPHKAHLGIEFRRARNIEIRGILIRDSPHWTIAPRDSDNVTIRDVKIINYRINGDGVDPANSRNVLIDSAFIYSSDDSISVKGTTYWNMPEAALRPTSHITISNSFLLNSAGFGIHVGDETQTPTLSDVQMINNDMFMTGGPLAILVADRALVSDLHFENLRIEEYQGYVLSARVEITRYSIDTARGSLENVRLRNVEVLKKFGQGASYIAGYGPQNTVSGVTFENMVIEGKRLTSPSDAGIYPIAPDLYPQKPSWWNSPYQTDDAYRSAISFE